MAKKNQPRVPAVATDAKEALSDLDERVARVCWVMRKAAAEMELHTFQTDYPIAFWRDSLLVEQDALGQSMGAVEGTDWYSLARFGHKRGER